MEDLTDSYECYIFKRSIGDVKEQRLSSSSHPGQLMIFIFPFLA